MPTKNKIYKALLFGGDIIVLYASLFLALSLRYGMLPDEKIWETHKIPFLAVFSVWLLIFYIAGLYDLEKFISQKELQRRIIQTIGFAGIVAILLFYLIPSFGITPKTNLAITLLITLALLIFWRRFFISKMARAKKIKILFFGISDEISSLITYLLEHPQMGFEPALIMRLSSDTEASMPANIPVLDFEHNMAKVIKEKGISLVITSGDIKQNRELVRMFYEVLPLGVSIVDFSRFYEEITGKVPVSLINETWFLENLVELNKGVFEAIKRWMDIMLAILLGVITVAATPVIAVAIKADSRGPVLYKQKRMGKNGKIFEIIKFRSMTANAEKGGAVWARENDARITRVGNILRKTRLDELPQLWNVLTGDLSFVGPRPERPEFIETLEREIPYYEMRNLVKPGLSGWAQINFPYGASVEDAMEKLQYDLYYIKNRSLTLELSIYLKTIATVISRQGR